jgi:hypothetical protein
MATAVQGECAIERAARRGPATRSPVAIQAGIWESRTLGRESRLYLLPGRRMPRKIEARQSDIHGNGVFAIAPIEKGERVVEYKGKRRTHEEVDEDDTGDVDSGHTFLFTLNDDYVIDANHKGNKARWINHSCDPNCEAVIEEHDGKNRKKDKVFIEAIRAIKPGEELTYNYGIVLAEPHTARLKKIWACRCGSKKCTGTMLQPKKGR